MEPLKQFLKLIRIDHWIKNLAVFLPIFFAGEILNVINDLRILNLLLIFFAFCITSSIIYIINDAVDKDTDRLHPIKRNRPLASGYFSKRSVFIFIIILLLIDIFFVFQLNFEKWFIVGYLIINIAYSFKLKNIAVLDVTCISLGFLLRIFAGGMAATVIVSHWMIIIVFLLSISIALAKRRDDLIIKKEDQVLRHSQHGYSLQFIDIAIAMSFSVTLVCYIMYSVSKDVIERIGSEYIYSTSLFVFLGILRYLQIAIIDNNAGSPIKMLRKDVFMQFIVLSWVGLFSFIIYS